MKTVAFFNNKGGVGKTTLVYHFAHMVAEMGHRILVVDLDPQANLTTMFLDEERLAEVYPLDGPRTTILAGIAPLNKAVGDIAPVQVHAVNDKIGLLAGDLDLSLFEDKLSTNWSKCLDGDEAAFRVVSSLHRIIQHASDSFEAEYCVIDLGPNFGPLNRASLISADCVVVPMGADLFSLQGLKNVGDQIRSWKKEWADRRQRNPVSELTLPEGEMRPLGYVVMQHGAQQTRPVHAYLKWSNRIPAVFWKFVLREDPPPNLDIESDQYCLALLKHHHSLMPMAMEVRKPIFMLKPADGAIGAHLQAVRAAYQDFQNLAKKILSRAEE